MVPNLMSITSKMANMQSIYNQASRPLAEVSKNPILDVDSNYSLPANALKKVMRNQVSYVNQDHITSQRHAFENVIQNQVLNVNQDHIQPRQALKDSHQDKVLDDKQNHIQPETIISQLDILAVLMNTTENMEFVATSTFLNQGWFIDLLLNTGVAKLTTAISNEPIPKPEPEINPKEEVQDLKILDQPNQESQNDQDKTFLPSMNHYIEDDLLCLQKTLKTDIKLNNGSIDDMDIDDSSWTLDHQIYQNSSNSTSTSTIPTIQDNIENDDIKKSHAEQEEEQIDDQEEPQIEELQDNDPDKATIYVPNLSKETTKKSLIGLFTAFGTIKKIKLKTQRRSKNKNAIIIFANQHNARSAMLSLNSTTYRNQESNIRMSKKKSFLAFQDQPEVSSMSRLCTLVQDIQNEPSNSNKDNSIAAQNNTVPRDIPEMSKLTITKCNKRKLIPTQLQQEITSNQGEFETSIHFQH